MAGIELPHEWKARVHQRPMMKAMLGEGEDRKKRAACVWHRRAGKDSCSINFTIAEAHQKIATYWHMLPTAVQARKVVWDAINPHTGIRVIDQAIPPAIRKSVNNTEMKIELHCGSIWQCVGSDTYDSLVGSNPYGIVFSEYSVADPRAWDFIRPILLENGGWAIFIYTFRGKNHGFDLYEVARKNPDHWFSQILTIEDTYRDDGVTPIITREQYEQEINDGMDPLLAAQEYYCSPDAGLVGSYYNAQIVKAEADGRLGDFPWVQDNLVTNVWDLGINDDNFIIFAQPDGEYVRIIDAIYGNGEPMTHWIKECQNMPYVYDWNYAPHDIGVHDYTIGMKRADYASNMNFPFEEVPKVARMDGIDTTRRFISKCRFNMENVGVQHLVSSLRSYRKEFDDKKKVFKQVPAHDWSSHGADAMRYLSIAWDDRPASRGSTVAHLVKRRGFKPKVIRAVGGTRRNNNMRRQNDTR